ncbi:MAG TPA: YsnF/AvaK domain-containing protein [Polyangia bacterium]|nr:YsnF/AvaK domain-containing protein [Polyangia bacterium]
MRWSRSEVRTGMAVTSTKGERLGNVIRTGADTFVVEKGVFFPKDYELRYDHITGLSGDQIAYSLSDADSRFGNVAETARAGNGNGTLRAAVASVASAATGAAARTASAATATTRSGDVRIPLREEEIGIEKVSRETGHVRIHKTVKTEEKHFSVPVTREDVVIERISATGDEASISSELAFEEQTLDLPLHEEDVQVSKRTRVREQIVVHPVVQAIEKEASATLRHEEAEIEDTRGRALRNPDGSAARNADGSVTRPGYGTPGSR